MSLTKTLFSWISTQHRARRHLASHRFARLAVEGLEERRLLTAPAAPTFGYAASATDGLMPDSDTGLIGQNDTYSDSVTSDTAPAFFGFADANSVVQLFVDMNGNGAIETGTDVAIGAGVVEPLSLTNGMWSIQSNVNLNSKSLVGLPLDGVRTILSRASNLAGEASAAVSLRIYLDTRGPQVTGVLLDPIDTALPEESVFDIQPLQIAGATPLTRTIAINLRDLPPRATGFLHGAINSIVAVSPGQYRLVGDANGAIAVASIIVTNNPPIAGNLATARVELNFATPLPDDRYSLFISDRIVDDAGNALDGESNSSEPLDVPSFPTGDGQPGGAYTARFTVDSRPEIGTFANGAWYIDLNGNGSFDPDNRDFVNRDVAYKFGKTGDLPVVGDWDGNGFAEIGVYGKRADGYRFELDLNGNGAFDPGDASFKFGTGGKPVAGNWDGAANGAAKHVGVFSAGKWVLDLGAAAYFPATTTVVATTTTSAMVGLPIAGDWTGNGTDRVGTLSGDVFSLDVDGNRMATGNTFITFGFGTTKQVPIAADWDADGDANIGLFTQDRTGLLPTGNGEWYADLGTPFTGPLGPTLSTIFGGNGGSLTGNAGDGLFQPPPTGGLLTNPNLPFAFQDIFWRLGNGSAGPVVGNLDPPRPGAVGAVAPVTTSKRFTITADAGAKVKLAVEAFGKTRWQYSIDGGLSFRTIMTTAPTLSVVAKPQLDQRVYRVTYTNKYGQIATNTFTLVVQAAPKNGRGLPKAIPKVQWQVSPDGDAPAS